MAVAVWGGMSVAAHLVIQAITVRQVSNLHVLPYLYTVMIDLFGNIQYGIQSFEFEFLLSSLLLLHMILSMGVCSTRYWN